MRWPSELPERLEIDGFSGTLPITGVRTQMDAGASFQRQRYSAAPEPYSGAITIHIDDWPILYQFWRGLGYGVLPFEWVHPITGQPATVQFDCTSPPEERARSGEYLSIALNIEVLPGDTA